MAGRVVGVSASSQREEGPLMIWKNRKPTPKTRLRWNWPEIWATIGVSAALMIVVAAFYYGYSL